MEGRDAAWVGTAQVLGGVVPFPSRLADGQPIADPARPRLDLVLATLVAGLGRPVGFGAEVQLPFGVIATEDLVSGRQASAGLGDLEVRARYAGRVGPVRLQGGVGAALPTGPSIARSGEAAILENARYLTLGRGVTWALLDGEARVTLPARLGLFASSTARLALYDARDGLRWGPEVRGTLGLTWGPVLAERLALSLGLEAQWRATSTEVDPFSGARVPSVNTGGTWLTLTPTAQVRLVGTLRAFVAGRLPVTQWLPGLQFIPGPGLFVGVGGALELFGAPTPRAAPIARGQVTLVEYGATWCAPCARLEPLLAAAERRYPQVQVTRVDASAWSPEQLEQALPGVAGLPVVEIFRADGTRHARLVGDEVFEFEQVLEEALR